MGGGTSRWSRDAAPIGTIAMLRSANAPAITDMKPVRSDGSSFASTIARSGADAHGRRRQLVGERIAQHERRLERVVDAHRVRLGGGRVGHRRRRAAGVAEQHELLVDEERLEVCEGLGERSFGELHAGMVRRTGDGDASPRCRFETPETPLLESGEMGNAIDRLLLGGAFVFGGLIHRKVGQVDDRVGLVEDVVEDLALSPQVPGMPLPTGYGLQVKGPASEDILIPVCLPPGFELGSLVLKPSFLPDEEQRRAPAARARARRRRRRRRPSAPATASARRSS